jgi:multidrug resistance efflux pump
MRGRWASAAIGAGIARRRMGNEMGQQSQMYEQQQQESQRQIEAQQREIERMRQQQQQQHTQPQHEDPTQKLLKYADLKQKGIISEEEFQKLKASLLSQI